MKFGSRMAVSFMLVGALACSDSNSGGPDYATEMDEATLQDAALTSGLFAVGTVDVIMHGGSMTAGEFRPPVEDTTFASRLILDIRTLAVQRSGRPELASGDRPHLISSVCKPVETGVDDSGEPIDSDGDWVPDDYTASYPSPCTATEGDWTYTYSGSMRLRDLPGLFGYKVEYSNFSSRDQGPDGYDYRITLNGTEQAVYTSSSVRHSANFTTATRHVGMYEATMSWDEETDFTPDGTISLVEEMPSGDLDLAMTFRFANSPVGEPDQAYQIHLSTPEPLRYNTTSSCDPDWPDEDGIVGGSLKGVLVGNEDLWFRYTWTGCGDSEYESHGTTDGGVTVARPFAAR